MIFEFEISDFGIREFGFFGILRIKKHRTNMMAHIKKKYLIGIDIGGTKTSVTLGTTKGKILDHNRFSSRSGQKPVQSISEICDAIHSLVSKYHLSKNKILGVGVAVPGHIDVQNGIVLKSPNLPGWRGLALKSILRKKLKLPVFVDNDANVTALGESYFGEGRKFSDFLYVTVSTGIGSGIFANGRLVRGTSGVAGELGHMTVVPNGIKCNCGKRGCLEAYASGTAIENYVKKNLNHKTSVNGSAIAQAAKKGDRLSIRARLIAADYLGIGLANVINLLNPEAIILGGGVMSEVHYFWDPMIAAIKRETWPAVYKTCKIIRSKLKDKVADFGVLALVLESRKIAP
ncbi:MAG: hypothetical protein A3G33_03500 [Omnitrophica bacterium RIFCSPLOWO2_12_FULL_44_17]|uniref:ROK family protein n=1 Tax=Candidatus Danuiimicrobium aquiferis TaxID=1801832 RepID=A0A1G1KTY9_9BACT|nr:MAG: hypothetical protein A3B72_07045 [Omnitrophica bacterium RIFCSPHIGHO2_02_FULL_45_28]OGW88734.1 MAG: hypothetical protein A3E74_05275 [Omnitrophica bacterium RIFCSPHIGHO2_12_FULL_44_12]OGW96380.1 MAG: hypothetical protein A3G33_03500 [Omnitrophica bacterium RIFCSPLOWO2_12_FULL_44_17]